MCRTEVFLFLFGWSSILHKANKISSFPFYFKGVSKFNYPLRWLISFQYIGLNISVMWAWFVRCTDSIFFLQCVTYIRNLYKISCEIISFYSHPTIRYAYISIAVCKQQSLATFNYKISSLFRYKKDMKLLRTLHWELTLNSCSVKFIILFAKLFEIYRVSRNAVSVRNFGKSLLIWTTAVQW